MAFKGSNIQRGPLALHTDIEAQIHAIASHLLQYTSAFKNVVTPSYLSCLLHSWTSLEVLAASQDGCCMQQSVPLSSHTENGENDVTVIVLSINRRWSWHNISVLCSPLLQREQGLSLWQHVWVLPHLQSQLLWGSGCVTVGHTHRHACSIYIYYDKIS